MTHSRKKYLKTTWIGGEEYNIYKVGKKIVAYQDGEKVKEWKDDVRFRMFEIQHMDDIQMSVGI